MSMREYKVVCENNKPIEACLLNFVNYKELINLSKEKDKKIINWLVVVGENENDAINAASQILQTYWQKYLEPQNLA